MLTLSMLIYASLPPQDRALQLAAPCLHSQITELAMIDYKQKMAKKKYLKGIEPNPIRTDNLQEIPSKLESDALPLRHGSCCY
jgi:hypothetical protein